MSGFQFRRVLNHRPFDTTWAWKWALLHEITDFGRIVTCPTYLDKKRIYRFNEKIKILLNYLVSFPWERICMFTITSVAHWCIKSNIHRFVSFPFENNVKDWFFNHITFWCFFISITLKFLLEKRFLQSFCYHDQTSNV